ncbi:TPA: hypothetical protein N0F65_009434 [Lagenidium giganteum]|uniref:Uncharacterized protein n=1 Tax=Lagenidium giganteum TaxID=4803 RepID=A0AAV2ZBG1_9STRA|nr:TPA: hypothetical protein N0F65_009434 [Lagenidium giganteum]
MQRLLRRWRPRDAAETKLLNEGIEKSIHELRQLGRRHTPEQFESAPVVTRAKSAVQLCRLGNLMYENAETDEDETRKALFLWKKAMEKGSDAAKFSYAMCLKKGIGVDGPNINEATKYFQELTTAGHAWGTFAYADALSKGDGVRKNEKKAFELFKRCADHGIPPAYMNVANMYQSGTGTEKNEHESIVYLHKAADAGDPSAKARLGELYFHGKGVPQDRPKAVRFYKEAAVLGVVTAQFNLGFLFLTGDGVPRNALQAEALFRQAADQGFVMAMVNLAQMYRTGYDDVPQNVELARKWLELAAPHDLNAKELLQMMDSADKADTQ